MTEKPWPTQHDCNNSNQRKRSVLSNRWCIRIEKKRPATWAELAAANQTIMLTRNIGHWFFFLFLWWTPSWKRVDCDLYLPPSLHLHLVEKVVTQIFDIQSSIPNLASIILQNNDLLILINFFRYFYLFMRFWSWVYFKKSMTML